MLTREDIINIMEKKDVQLRLRKALIESFLSGDQTPHVHLKEAYEGRNPGQWGAIYIKLNANGDFYLKGRGEYQDLELEITNILKEEELCF